jgi:hypothetical protein
MRTILLIILLTGFWCGNLNAQTAIEPKKEKWIAHNSTVSFSDDGLIHLTNTSEKSALLWVKDTNFMNGTVELDIKGKDVRGESFVGIAFHGADNDYYDGVYFRPFNFRSPDRKDHSVQYIDKPASDWEVLRETFPGKYENHLHPVPDPNDWFHAKIVIDFPEVLVYVNGSMEASLKVEQISLRKNGKLGLWIDGKEGWFKNVVITNSN